MRILAAPKAIVRHKAACFALIAGLLTALACWWWLPPSPRSRLSLPIESNDGDAVFSPDFHFAMIRDQAQQAGVLWDLSNSRRLFSVRWESDSEFRRFGISAEHQVLVELSEGRPKYWKLPFGDRWEPSPPVTFPFDRARNRYSCLASDSKGNLLVLVQNGAHNISIHDLYSGKEMGSAPANSFFLRRLFSSECLGRLIDDDLEVRELPGGKRLGAVPSNFAENQSQFLADRPDGKTFVSLSFDGAFFQLRDVATGTQRFVKLKYNAYVPHNIGNTDEPIGTSHATISPDGHFLASTASRRIESVPWIAWLLTWLGHKSGPALVVYDLSNGAEIAVLGAAKWTRFSLDGDSLAVRSLNSLDIYDFPLRRPRARIAVIALTVLASVWLLGWFLGRLSGRRRHANGRSVPSSPSPQ